MATKIVTKNSSTASAVPTASDLLQGELAVNVADKRLFTEDNAGAIVELGTNPSTLTVTGEITANGGIALGDGDKATFGAGDDLQIYSDGSYSYIQESSGTSGIRITSDNQVAIRKHDDEDIAVFNIDGAVRFYHDNAQKFSTTSTGIDVTGTATMDGLSVDGDSTLDALELTASSSFPATGFSLNANGFLYGMAGSQGFILRSASNSKALLNISENNDISFYEDTGTTPKLFWDASAESLGIGTSSPTRALDVSKAGSTILANFKNTGGATSFITLGNTTATADQIRIGSDGADLTLSTNYTERLRISSDGSVGIGVSPSYVLDLQNTDGGVLARFKDSDSSHNGIVIAGDVNAGWVGNSSTTTGEGIYYQNSLNAMRLYTNSSERMRIDSSGNLLVGKTSASSATVGFQAGQDGFVAATRASAQPLVLNRTTDDGTILDFRREGTTTGTVGSAAGNLYIVSNDVGLNFAGGGDGIYPATADGAQRDAAIDLGHSSHRFKDLYLSGGVVFGATGGSVSSKTLDDYEEGTCNLKWSDGTNDSAVIACKYTKVGRLVTVSGYASGNISGLTGTAAVQLAGFPFAFADYGSFALRTRNINAPTGCIGLVGFHGNSGASATLTFIVDNANYVSVLVSDMNATTNDAYFDVTYQTT